MDENIAFFAEIHGVRDYRSRRDRLLELTQLAPHRTRLADRLSGGMKQKLALACTLVHEPALLVLDEPTTGVDPVSRREFWKLLAEFLSQGITIVMATPYLDEAERCARVALLHEGRLLALDRPDALRSTLPGALFEVIVADHRRAPEVIARIDGVSDVQMFGERAHVRMDRAGAEAAQLLSSRLTAAGLDAASVRPISTSLEDVFIARLHEETHADDTDKNTDGSFSCFVLSWLFVVLGVSAPLHAQTAIPLCASPSKKPSHAASRPATGSRKPSHGRKPPTRSPTSATRRRCRCWPRRRVIRARIT